MARVVWLAFLAACGGGAASPPTPPSNTGGSTETAPDLGGLRGLHGRILRQGLRMQQQARGHRQN